MRRDRADDRSDSRRPGFRRDAAMETFRLEVGHVHAVKPGNIVGAIANETGLTGREIGPIRITDTYSVVGVPESRLDSVIGQLKNTVIRGKAAQVRKYVDNGPSKGYEGKKPYERKSYGDKKPYGKKSY